MSVSKVQSLSWEERVRYKQILFNYYIELAKRVERRLAKFLDEEETAWSVLQPEITIGPQKARFILPIEIDISKITMEEQPCEFISEIEYSCGTSLEDDPDCEDPESEACKKKFKLCVDEHIEEFKREHRDPPFRLYYHNLADIEAEIVSSTVDHGDKLSAHDFLLVRYVWEPDLDYLPILEKDMERRKVNYDYVAERIADYVRDLVKVVEILAER